MLPFLTVVLLQCAVHRLARPTRLRRCPTTATTAAAVASPTRRRSPAAAPGREFQSAES